MKLFHVTLRTNRASIAARGIDPAFSKGARKECWFVNKAKLAWAVLHVMDRHDADLEDVLVYEVLVRRNGLTRRWKGVWTSSKVVDPLFITETITGKEIAAERITVFNPDTMHGG